MFRRRPEPQVDPGAGEAAGAEPVPTTVPRPARAATGMAGMGLRARPSGLGSRLRSIFGAGAPATDATWDEVEEALIAADVGATTTLDLVDAARVPDAVAVLSAVDGAGEVSASGRRVSTRLPHAGSALPRLLREVDARGIALDAVEVRRPTLDDVFLTMTGRSLREES